MDSAVIGRRLYRCSIVCCGQPYERMQSEPTLSLSAPEDPFNHHRSFDHRNQPNLLLALSI